MPAPKNNQHAAKNKGHDSALNIKCKQSDKDDWIEVAKATGNNLTDWSNQALNAAAVEYCKAAREEYFKLDRENKVADNMVILKANCSDKIESVEFSGEFADKLSFSPSSFVRNGVATLQLRLEGVGEFYVLTSPDIKVSISPELILVGACFDATTTHDFKLTGE